MPHPWITERLRIRRFRRDDGPDLFELQGDPAATEFVGGPWTIAKTRETLDKIVDDYEIKELEWFAVADRETDKVLGVCWLGELNVKWCEALGVGPQIELGYRYARAHWGKGYATEAARAMLQRGFDELKLPAIAAIVNVQNTASERVIQKLHMRPCTEAGRDGVRVRLYQLSRDVWFQNLPR
jgi:[ribosomal protein S5]-alanine N-acetyltransferase